VQSEGRKVNSILGCIRKNVASRLTKVILYLSSAPHSHLEYHVQFWTPQCVRDMDIIEQT